MPDFGPVEDYDAFADAKLTDSFKVLQERRQFFRVVEHEHIARQDLGNGGEIIETVTVRWRPLPVAPAQTNGFSHGDLQS